MLSIQKSRSEDEIIAGCRRRKSWAQKALYERIGSRMLAVCYRYISDRDEAEHVMIGGMVKVYDKIDQYTGEGHFEGWIRRIMVNESLMYIRKHKNMSVEVEIDQTNESTATIDHDDHLQTEDLMLMIEKLPVGYRTVFNLYAIEGYSHAEIAEQLGINENTSKSQLSRARKLLQQQINDLEQRELNNTNENGF
ncbi:MAG: RNA polymerase sigma factor [Cyclobacteriaceae bacterium]